MFSMRPASPANTWRSWFAYGRALTTRSCARRNFAAETVFIALVSCCVFLTDRIRRRISRRLGISGRAALFSLELCLRFLQYRPKLALDFIIESLLLANLAK